jgi:hypothetical protein
MMQMMVTVPDGVMPGQQIQVHGPNGQAFFVTVPEGVDAGGQFSVMMPDATQMQAPAVQMVSAEANGDKDGEEADDEEEPRSGQLRLFSCASLSQVPKVYFNLVKTNVNTSLFYPRKLTPAFIRMKQDPLKDLQIWERIIYILLSIHIVLCVSSIVMIVKERDGIEYRSDTPFNPNDSDFARPLCTTDTDTDCMRTADVDGTPLTLSERKMNYESEVLVEEWVGTEDVLTGSIYALIIKMIVSDPVLALFLATKGRKELAKTDKCYMWCGWGLLAVPLTAFFMALGVESAWMMEGYIQNNELYKGWVLALLESWGLPVGPEDLNNHTFWGMYSDTVVNFVIAELTTPFISPFYLLIQWLLIPAKPMPWCCHCMIAVYFYYYMFYPFLWFEIWICHKFSCGCIPHPKTVFTKGKKTMQKQWLKYFYVEDEKVQDPDLEEKTVELFGAYDSMCPMASSCCVSTQIDIAPESESDDDQPADFESFKNKVKKKLAGETSQEKPDVTVKDDVSDDEVFVID